MDWREICRKGLKGGIQNVAALLLANESKGEVLQ